MLGQVVEFWFSDEVEPFWFRKDEEFDELIKEKFLSLYQIRKNANCVASNLYDNLALIILFDQFPRNMFRNSPQSFETDYKAIEIAKYVLGSGLDKKLDKKKCRFLYMPFMHSEDIEEQNYSVELYRNLGDKAVLEFAIRHQEIIAEFGRFPHRNHILGRTSTKGEERFLKEPGSSF